MKNIMFFTHHLWGGGAEKTVCNLSNYINENCSDITSYVCVVYDEPLYDKVKNVIVLRNKSNPKTPKFIKPLIILKQVIELKKIKKERNIAVCISFLPGADIINVLSDIGEKKIVSVRNVESFFLNNCFKKIYDKYSYIKCDKIVAVSETVKKDLVSNFGVNPNKIVTIYNAISEIPEKHECIKEFYDFIEGKFVFINIARLAPEKNQYMLLKAFAILAKEKEDARLVIVGSGSEEKKLKECSKDLGIIDKVLFTGKQRNPFDYLEKSDVFVLCSKIEGMPNTLLEALQSGLPCIVTDSAGAEIIAPDRYRYTAFESMSEEMYGVVVPNDNIDELYIAMKEMMDNKQLKDNYEKSFPIESFSMKTIVSKWIEVIY